ncbi:S-layer homology domain-containing protein [Paenibacillus sp. D2_2]|uniref:S-layer homology domain-containing protein n=1 Tax=Paenibacillus sp. D2_2 TaxID=3073092 RepID=UPI00281523AB|nr:S-layer homology domain-containing protein [Paenibacillus sp. D2_2]WMT40456.1 S-layer homology domain-containing protein [Paenibacillus sp. D2_2]
MGKSGQVKGSELGEFNQPVGIAVDNQGSVYIADRNNHRIQKAMIDKQERINQETGEITYEYPTTWSEWKKASGGPGSELGEFDEPNGVAIDGLGNVYVADSNNHRIQKLNLATDQWIKWGKDYDGPNVPKYGYGSELGEFDYPTGVTIDRMDNVYVADYGNNRIQKLGDDGLIYSIAPVSNQTLTELTAGYSRGKQETRTITITRTGTADLDDLSVSIDGTHAGSFEIVGPTATNLDEETKSTTFTIKAKDGLAADTYNVTVTIKAKNMADVAFYVTQVVKVASNPGPDMGPNPGTVPTTGESPARQQQAEGEKAGEAGDTGVVEEAETHKPFINGFIDGTFGPEKIVTRSQMAVMLTRNLGIKYEGNETSPFKDTNTKHWAFKEIEMVNQAGLMQGYADGSFDAEKAITRAEMAVIVDHLMAKQGKTGISAEHQVIYADLSDKHWAYEAIMRSQAYGIMEGYPDSMFKPNQKLTRAEAVKILNRLFERGPLYGVETPSFLDVPTNHWAFHEIEEAAKEHQWVKDAEGREMKK